MTGYDKDFLSKKVRIPLPGVSKSLEKSVLRKPGVLRKGKYSDHIHFTLMMNKHTKQLIYSACNIDQSQFLSNVSGKGKRSWRNDPDIGPKNQLDNRYYKDREHSTGKKIPNPYDRGHMVMRHNNMWGATKTESDKAGKATFIYANSSLQHENLNRDEWKAIEDIVRDLKLDKNNKLSVFTGPIFGDQDRHIHLSDHDSARVPSGFFKVICFIKKQIQLKDELGVLTFAVFQDDTVLRDKKGGRTIKTDRRYQVTISEVQKWTGIKFDKALFDANPLYFFKKSARKAAVGVPRVPERIPIGISKDVVTKHAVIRSYIEYLSERKIIINSAMINPVGKEPRDEWISLHNRGDNTISVKGWTLTDGIGRKATLMGNIKSGESLLLKGKKKGKVLLSNKGGSLMLHDNNGRIIDHVTWSKKQIDRMEEGIAFLFENRS